MEIEDIRQELNHLLENVVEHSTKYSDERPIPSLEISFVLSKINKMQENLSVLKHLLEEHENTSKQARNFEGNTSVEIIEDKKKEQVEFVEEVTIETTSSLSDNLEQSPIPKLIDALTLNDRYLFANELFDKDMNAFNNLVKSIDSCSSLDEANEMIIPLGWDGENEQVQFFNNLVERRFL